MKKCVINGSTSLSRAELHENIAKSLDFPEWYGKNLDALYDCLDDISEETVIEITDFEALRENYGKYALRLVKVILDVCEENENIRIKFKDGQ